MSTSWIIYTDGGSRGNPGPAAYAYVIKRPGESDIEEKCYLGSPTNNIAEYTGMVKALEHALELGAKAIIVHSDSELMVKQMSGVYRVKSPGLQELYKQAVALRKKFNAVTIKHVYREQNTQADALCNEALDYPCDAGPRIGSVKQEVPPKAAPVEIDAALLTPTMRALALLKRSAAAWAESGDANDPPPAQVLGELVEILEPG